MRPNATAICEWRRARNLSLRALQHLTGLNRGYLSRLERGLIRESGEGRLLKVAGALDVSVESITHEETK